MLRPYFFACTFPPGAHSPAMTDLKRSLRLVDGLAMVVGIMVGTGIFRTPGLVAGQLGRPWLTFVAWIAGGALALAGALCFAELATRHPAAGGKYVYVREAFGPRAGFVVGWVEGLAIYPAAIAGIAVVAGEYTGRLLGLEPGHTRWVGAGMAALFTAINLAGVASGRLVQNVVTAAKLLALAGVVVLAFTLGHGAGWHSTLPAAPTGKATLVALALVNAGGTPWVAMLLVGAVAIALAATGSFESLLGLAITVILVIDGFTVLSLFRLRARQPGAPFLVPGFPWVPLAFVGVYAALFVGTAVGRRGLVAKAGALLVGAYGLSWMVEDGGRR